MVRIIDIPIEPLTDEAFSSYGSVITELQSGMPPLYGIKPARPLDFSIDGAAHLVIVRYPSQSMQFSRLERHLLVTETRVALNPLPTVMVVAPRTREDDPQDYPDPASVRAFLLNGQQGVMLHTGIWHGLDCYPVKGSHADFLVISEARTEDELLGRDPGAHRYSNSVDFLERCRTKFHIVDPLHLRKNAGTPPLPA